MQTDQLKQKLQDSKILYVEDDSTIRQQISEFLRRYIDVLNAVSSAEEALEIYLIMMPDILLLDMNLPGKSGLILAKDRPNIN